jgi:hypothetical protein
MTADSKVPNVKETKNRSGAIVVQMAPLISPFAFSSTPDGIPSTQFV